MKYEQAVLSDHSNIAVNKILLGKNYFVIGTKCTYLNHTVLESAGMCLLMQCKLRNTKLVVSVDSLESLKLKLPRTENSCQLKCSSQSPSDMWKENASSQFPN